MEADELFGIEDDEPSADEDFDKDDDDEFSEPDELDFEIKDLVLAELNDVLQIKSGLFFCNKLKSIKKDHKIFKLPGQLITRATSVQIARSFL